jgi:hypothetical protein
MLSLPFKAKRRPPSPDEMAARSQSDGRCDLAIDEPAGFEDTIQVIFLDCSSDQGSSGPDRAGEN